MQHPPPLLPQPLITPHSIYLYPPNHLQHLFYHPTQSKQPFPSLKPFPQNPHQLTQTHTLLMFCSPTPTAQE
ncbi:DUF2529 family protein, partial [Bacillus subtilis]|uniref:DUF2529 family protein n=1 Tax=Bacillus subtilis TaxID=1423 RepID=UPI00338D7DBB